MISIKLLKKNIAISCLYLVISCCLYNNYAHSNPNSFILSEAVPLYFSVNKLEVLDNYKMPLTKPNVEHKMRRSPSVILTSWAHNVIRTEGNAGYVKLIINRASATVNNIDAKNTIFNFFKNKQSYRVKVIFSGRLEIFDKKTKKSGYINIETSFSKTAPEAASLSELEKIYDYVTIEALGKFDKEFRKRLLDLSDFLI